MNEKEVREDFDTVKRTFTTLLEGVELTAKELVALQKRVDRIEKLFGAQEEK